jgi:integrase
LTRLLAEVENGTAVDPSKLTVAEWLRGWFDDAPELSPKTLKRYRQLAEQQIIPHLGASALQKLKPVQVHSWHGTLLKSGGAKGRPLSARTVGHAHRVLHRALERAMRLELISRNVAHAIRPSAVDAAEVEILGADQIADVLATLADHWLYPIASLALATGIRRGELCGLAWGALDLDGATVRVERSLEETAAGLRFKSPKTRAGRRTISLPASAVETLRAHRRAQMEHRLAVGLGRLGDDDLVFARADASPHPPDNLSRDWRRTVLSLKLPHVSFHALRHSHVSALIAAGLDVVTISRRLGHANPAVTLGLCPRLLPGQQGCRGGAGDRSGDGCQEVIGTVWVPIGCQFADCSPPLCLAAVGWRVLSVCPAYAVSTPLIGGGVAEWLKAAVC